MMLSKPYRWFTALVQVPWYPVLLAIAALCSFASSSLAGDQSAVIRAIVGVTKITLNGGTIVATVGQQVPKASELKGTSTNSSIQLECPNGATQTLTGEFDAVIDPSDAKTGCTVSLLDGTVIATTAPNSSSTSPAVGGAAISGPVSMVSYHTQFGVIVKKHLSADGFVIEGDASALFTDHGAQAKAPVPGGSTIAADTKQITAIRSDRFGEIALTYAQLDLSQGSASASGDQASLQSHWLAALQNPSDALARIELCEAQAAIGATTSGIFDYELQRAVTLAELSGQKDLKARAAKLMSLRAPHAPTGFSIH